MEPNLKFQIFICAKEDVRKYDKHGITHFVSINDPNDKNIPTGPYTIKQNTLYLSFYDLNKDSIVYSEKHTKFPPNKQDIEKIIDFAEKIKKNTNNEIKLLVQCGAGISRSTAAAFIIASLILGAGKEEESLDMVYQARPQMIPNIWMVEMADEILRRNGAMFNLVKNYKSKFAWLG